LRRDLARTSVLRGSPESASSQASALLEVHDLSIAFPARTGFVAAATDVSFSLAPGRTLGLVGESGCGKSVTLRSILGLIPYPGEVISGEIRWRDEDLLTVPRRRLVQVRGREIGMIFQDATASLNPVLTVGAQLRETLHKGLGLSRGKSAAAALDLLTRVGIPSPARRLDDYPHQLSGGMRQRVMIALAIAGRPGLLLADEPTTALDVTIQDQILSLLADLQAELGMAMIIVSHDFGVIARSCDDVAVMYAGHIVEAGTAEAVLHGARHPYTRGLLRAIPDLPTAQQHSELDPIPGQPPHLADLPAGCPFQARCAFTRPACAGVEMRLKRGASAHVSACPFVEGESDA
jgi:oligopeptide/dipeptide ABC transporter ATP-binding protein